MIIGIRSRTSEYGLFSIDSLEIQREFQGVIVAPHARFSGGNFRCPADVSQPFGR